MDNSFDAFDNFDNFEDIEDIESLDVTEKEEQQQEVTTASTDDFDNFSDFTDGFDSFDDTSETESDSSDNLPEELVDSTEESVDIFEDDDSSTENSSDFDNMFSQATESSSLMDEMNEQGSWVSGAEVLEETGLEAANDAIKDTTDVSDFDSLFVGNSKPAATTGTTTSVLEQGKCTSEAFELKYISIADIIVWSPRIRTSSDLFALEVSIKNDGLLVPIYVSPTATKDKYVLIKGARRLMACARVGMKTIPCIVNNQISNSDIHVVEPLLSHTTKYSISDMLGYIKYLEKEKGITSAAMIEYLLNMESGDFLKLMDVMEDNDEDITTALLVGDLTISQAYKKLEQKRKKTGKTELANERAGKVYGNSEKYGADILSETGETGQGGAQLTQDEMNEIISGMGDIEDVSNEDGEELRKAGDSIEGYQAHVQDPNNRERLDPSLRKTVLARDNNTCRICGMGGPEYIETLDVHHIVPVFTSGADEINNLICACVVCHKLIHLHSRGEIHIRAFSEMNEAEANKFKRIIKLGNVIRSSTAKAGIKKEQLKKLDNAATIGRRLKGSSDQIAD